MIQVGDWIRFRWGEEVRIGVVQYVRQQGPWTEVVTDKGSLTLGPEPEDADSSSSPILERRAA